MVMTTAATDQVPAAPLGTPSRDPERLLTPSEWEIWSHQVRRPLDPAYNVTAVIEVEGLSDPERLVETVRGVLGEQPRLTSPIHRCAEGARWGGAGAAARVTLVDARPDRATGVDAWIRGAGRLRVQGEARRPFGEGEPLHRAVLWRLEGGRALLQLTLHHVACDGLSLRHLVTSVIDAHAEVALTGGDQLLPDAPAASADEARAFWADHPADHRTLLAADTESPGSTGPGKVVTRQVAVDLERWHGATGRLGVSPFSAALCAVGVGLGTWAGEERLTVRVPVSVRRPSEDREVSYRVASVPVTLRTRHGPAWDEAFQDVQEQLHQAALHAGAEEGPGGTGTAGTAVCVVNQLAPRGLLTHDRPPASVAGGVHWRPYLLHNGSAKFDLTVFVAASSGRLVLHLEHRADRYLTEAVGWLADHLADTVEAVLLGPRRGSGPREPDVTRGTLTGPIVEVPARVETAFFQRAAEAPTAPCLVQDRGPTLPPVLMTYGELAAGSGAMAARLRDAGAGRGQLVALRLGRGAALYVAAHASLLAGAAILLVDPELPAGRAEYMLRDAGAALVVRPARDGEEPLPGSPPHEPVVLERRDATAAPPPPGDDDLAYVVYTSGSSGRPKGVAVPQRGIANRIHWMQREYLLAPGDRVLAKTPLGFDVCMWELFWPLSAGACAVLAQHGRHGDAEYLLDLVERYAVDTAHFVPSMLQGFLDVASPLRCGSLRRVLCSGEPLSVVQAARAVELTGARVHNLYGPAEASVDVAAWTYDPSDGRSFVPIGRPIDNITIHLCDEDGRPAAPGRVGEIVVSGVGVGAGYVGAAAKTAGGFSVDPSTGQRSYRTGDLARLRAGAVLEFLGRRDAQVKIAGQRAELGEIEAAAAELDGVASAGVVFDPERPPRERLTAYLVPSGTAGQVTAAELRRALAARLPRHMVPSRFVLVDQLPTTASGKLDRTALRATAGVALREDPTTARTHRPPAAPEGTRALLRELVAGVLRTEPDDVPADVDLFLLGLDSLAALRLAATAKERGLAMSVADVFEARTVARLANRVEPPSSPPPRAPGQDSPRPPTTGRYPVSRFGEGLLFHRGMSGDYVNYVSSVELHGRLRTGHLRRALQEVTARHELLRAVIDPAAPDGPEHVVATSASLELVEHDLRDLAAQGRSEVLDAWREAARRRTLDWERHPPFVLAAHRLADDRTTLSLVEPLLDGWSVAVVLRDLLDAYECAAAEHDRRVPPGSAAAWTGRGPLPSYAAFVELEREAEASPEARRFWRQALERPAAYELAVAKGSGEGAQAVRRVSHELPVAAVQRLRAAARQLGVPVRSLLLAAHLRTLALFMGHAAVATGLMVNGRPETAGGADMCGLFLNVVPLLVDVDPRGSWRSLVAVADAAERVVWRHRRFPYASLRELAPAARPDTVFNFTHFHRYADVVTDPARRLRMGRLDARDQTYFDVTVQCALDPVGQRLRLSVDHRHPTVAPGDARQFLDHLVHAVRTTTRDVDQLVSRSPLTPPARRRLAQFSCGPVETSEPPVVHLAEAVDAHARRQPDAVAIEDGTGAWTYRQVSAWSSGFAARILHGGVAEQPRVGVAGRRSARYWTSVLGVWRAGGTYVPLPPDTPAARVSQMVDQARVDVVVADPDLPAGVLAALVQAGVRVVDATDVPAAQPGDPVLPPRPMRAAAYVLFTSGSTGRPKGARIGPAAMVNHWRSKVDLLALRPGKAVAQSAPASFDVSLWQWAVPWLVGGRVVVLAGDVLLDARGLLDTLAARDVNVFETVPSHLAALLDAVADGAARLDRPDLRLEHLMVTGEAVPAATVRRWFAHSRTPVINAYGPTECADDVAHAVLAGPGASDPVPIGRPIRNSRLEVVDADGRLVPPGVAGQLRVSGACLGLGYVDPRDDAGRFVQVHRDTGAAPEPAYLTGDTARWDPAGELVWLGRTDDEVKVRGRRIALGDIEANLRTHPGVGQAAAVVVGDGEARRLRAILQREPTTPTADALRAHLAQRVPPWMVPDEVVVLDRLPLTAHGKLDRRALSAPQLRDRPLDEDGHLARPDAGEAGGGVAAVVREEWGRVLGRGAASGEDFFALGGSSLDSVRVVARIGRRLGIEVSVRDLVAARTFERFVDTLRSRAAMADLPRPLDPDSGRLVHRPHVERWVDGVSWSARRHWRGLLDHCPQGRLDAAAVGYISAAALARSGATREQARASLASAGGPVLRRLFLTPLGVVGHFLLPLFADELASATSRAVDLLARSVELAREAGAGRVALGGMLASALSLGQGLAASGPLAPVIRGHDVTVAAVVCNVARRLEARGETLADHDVAVVGLGSVGAAAARLVIDRLGTARSLTLCEVPSMAARAEAVAAELAAAGEDRVVVAVGEGASVHRSAYDASLLIGAASSVGVLDVDALRPSTVVVDDSAPHLFDVDRAVARVRRGELTVTEGGMLRWPSPVAEVRWLPPDRRLADLLASLRGYRGDAHSVMGCVTAGLLTAADELSDPGEPGAPPGLELSRTTYQRLSHLGLGGTEPMLEDVPLAGGRHERSRKRRALRRTGRRQAGARRLRRPRQAGNPGGRAPARLHRARLGGAELLTGRVHRQWPADPEVLQAVRSVWGRPERAGRRTPCFLLPCTPERPLPLEVSGWHADPRPLRVIVEPVARPGTRAEQAHAGVGVHALGTDEDEREFLELVGRCFPDVAGRPLLVTAPLRAAGVRTEVLTIREPGDGRLLAASAQSTRGGTAFQTWGSVDPTRRGEGLSRALQHVALHRAGSCGASGSVTVTRNPRVTGTRRPCVPMWIYEQESP